MPEFVSIREFARRVQVSDAAVKNAIDAGRIMRDPDTGKINWDTQQRAWYENRNPNMDRDHNDPNGRRAKINQGSEGDIVNTIAKAKQTKAVFEAKLKQLEYEEKSGKLIEKDFVKSVVFRFGKQVRDSVLTIPERVGAIYAAQVTENIKQILDKTLSPKLAQAVLDEIDQKEFENIARRVWANESRIVLEAIERGAKL